MSLVSMKDGCPREDMGCSSSTQDKQPPKGTSKADAFEDNDKLKDKYGDKIKKLQQELQETE